MGETTRADLPKRQSRPGQGRTTAPYEAKEYFGRASFRRPGGDHQGQRSNPTEYEAIKNIRNKPPTQQDMQGLFEVRPNEYNSYKASGEWSDEEIYKMMNK